MCRHVFFPRRCYRNQSTDGHRQPRLSLELRAKLHSEGAEERRGEGGGGKGANEGGRGKDGVEVEKGAGGEEGGGHIEESKRELKVGR